MSLTTIQGCIGTWEQVGLIKWESEEVISLTVSKYQLNANRILLRRYGTPSIAIIMHENCIVPKRYLDREENVDR